MDIVQVVVAQSRTEAAPVPAEGVYDVHLLRQLIEPDRIPEERVVRQDRVGIRDAVSDISLAVPLKKILHIVRCHFLLKDRHC